VSLLVAGLALFLGIHLLPMFPQSRTRLFNRLGEGRYKMLFSLASAVGLVLIVVGFANAPSTARVFAPFPAAIALAPLAITLAIILFAAANMRGHLRAVLRHPMLLGLLIWSTVHLLANGDLRGTVLFGAFLAYAVIDLVSASQRGAVKSFVPELKFDVMAIGGGIAVAFAVMALHRLLFGVRVVSFGV
jgi:uncharacterized membrane protein